MALINKLGETVANNSQPILTFETQAQYDAWIASLPDPLDELKFAVIKEYENLNLPGVRKTAKEDVHFYLALDGDDSNDGLSITTPKRTWPAIRGLMQNGYDYQGHSAIIHVGPGEWRGVLWTVSGHQLVGCAAVRIKGDGPTSTIIAAGINEDGSYNTLAAAFHGIFPCQIYLNDLGFKHNYLAIRATGNAIVHCDNVRISDCKNANNVAGRGVAFYSVTGGEIALTGDIEVSGNFECISQASVQGIITYDCNLKATGTTAVNLAVVYGSSQGYTRVGSPATFTGTITGKKYDIRQQAGFYGRFADSVLLGTLAGTVDTATYGLKY